MKGGLAQLIEALDEKSRAIVWHLWWHRHADIAELRDSIDASSDYEVLHRLKEVINEKAEKLLGKPIAGFEHSKTDPVTGEKVLFNWWFLNEDSVPSSGEGKPLVDVFNNKESVTVIAEVPTSVEISQPEVDFRNGILRLKVRKAKSGKSTKSGQKKRRRSETKGESTKA